MIRNQPALAKVGSVHGPFSVCRSYITYDVSVLYNLINIKFGSFTLVRIN